MCRRTASPWTFRSAKALIASSHSPSRMIFYENGGDRSTTDGCRVKITRVRRFLHSAILSPLLNWQMTSSALSDESSGTISWHWFLLLEGSHAVHCTVYHLCLATHQSETLFIVFQNHISIYPISKFETKRYRGYENFKENFTLQLQLFSLWHSGY